MTDKLERAEQPKKAQVKMAAAAETDGDSMVKKLESALSKLTTQVEAMQQQMSGKTTGASGHNLAQQGKGWHGNRRYGGGPSGERQDAGRHGTVQQGDRQAPQPQPQPGNMRPQFSQDARQSQLRACFKCGSAEHLRPQCPRRFEPTCWTCGNIGHRQLNCPELNCNDPLSGGGR